jgi:hypothetical protein
MPPFGTEAAGTAMISQLPEYVLSLPDPVTPCCIAPVVASNLGNAILIGFFVPE